ncbi:MAG: 16S rRNA (cytidine(1402)-2'-O)-methyltransferase, partial [Acidobacteria bacterium]|nr:16S rRNA (cytidine(1402)-2'-O)-methyltransferase [Acidobacteriota bacterium]
ATLIFYESPHRLGKSLTDCLEILGNRRAAVARELTKIHEEIVRGDLKKLSEKFTAIGPKGEFVLLIDRAADEDREMKNKLSLADRVKEIEREGLDHKTALKRAAKEFGLSKSEAYRILQGQKN